MSATVLTFPAPRTLAAVLLDITTIDQEFAIFERRAREAETATEEDDAGDEMARLDEQTTALRREAHALILASTGCSFEQIYRVLG